MIDSRLLGVLLAVFVGTTMGIGGYTFVYGKGASYLTNDPQACANCHVMAAQLSGWLQSSHRNVATCNDCHAPHGNLVGKYWTKARNGFAHSYAFTTGDFPVNMRIKPANLEVTEDACRYCHAEFAQVVDGPRGGEPRPCVTCHSDVGHRGRAPLLLSSAVHGAPSEVFDHE